MDQFPVNCHSCFSHKRQFYVFLQCRHFMCLSCCLCLADFQNLTIRCCYQNTKMSEQLASVMFQQVNCRKILKNSKFDHQNSMMKEQAKFQLDDQLENKKTRIIDKPSDPTRLAQYDKNNMGQSTIVHTFKMIEQKMHKNSIPEGNIRIKADKVHNSSESFPKLSNKQHDYTRIQQSQLSDPRQVQSPTFKQISNPSQSQNIVNYQREQSKQKFICWKNYDNTKDRILAKLNYHQLKINSLLKQHHYH